MRTLPFSGLVLLAVLAAPAPAQDVLTLGNGDRLTGELLAVDGATWTFKHAGGELKLLAAEVSAFSSERRLGLRLSDGTIAAGRVSASNGTMQFTADDGGVRTVAPADFAAVGNPDDLRTLEPVRIGFLSPFGKFWGARIGAGFSNASGNTRSRGFNGDATLERKTSKDRLTFNAGGATQWSSVRDDTGQFPDSLAKVAEKFYGSARLDVFLVSKVFMFGGTEQLIDKFQGVDLRSNYNAGVGYQVVDTDPTDLRFDVSGGLRVENFTPTEGDTTIATAVVAVGGGFQQKLGPVNFDWAIHWTPALEDVKDYRLLSTAGLSTEVFNGLGFRIGTRNEVNNRPPPGIDKHDWLLTFNLTYTLGG